VWKNSSWVRSLPAINWIVVHEKHINGVETITEADHAIEAQGVDDFNGKFFGAHVAQAHGRIALLMVCPMACIK